MIFKGPLLIHTFEASPDGHAATLRERLAMRKHCGPYQWTPQDAHKRPRGRGFYQSSYGELRMGDATLSLRLVWANDLLPSYSRLRDIQGYFTDEFEDQTLKPIVARLNHGQGFLAGWTMGKGMCASLDFDIYSSAEEAAHAAHTMAEQDAEREREYQEAESARIEAEDIA